MPDLSQEELNVLRESEELPLDEVSTSLDDLTGDAFVGTIAEIVRTSEYVVLNGARDTDANGKQKPKQPFITLYLDVDFMEDDYFRVRWRESRSAKGKHAIFLQHLAEVKNINMKTEEAYKEIGLEIEKMADLIGATFLWERKSFTFGKGEDAFEMEAIVPVEYYDPGEVDVEVEGEEEPEAKVVKKEDAEEEVGEEEEEEVEGEEEEVMEETEKEKPPVKKRGFGGLKKRK